MKPSQKEIETFLDAGCPWLSKPNIVGVHVGNKKVKGIDTGDLAIVVHVVHKKRKYELGRDDFEIPKEVEMHFPAEDGSIVTVNIPTDVVESGIARSEALNQKRRPCPGGFQIQGNNVPGFGTLGVNIIWGGKYRLLTNNHVISRNGRNTSDVWQPYDDLGNGLATVTGYIPVTTYPNQYQPNPVFNTQDLAWCDITPNLGDAAIYYIGTPAGMRPPVLGERVRMVGKETGQVMSAQIQSLTFQVTFQFGGTNEWAWFRNMIQLNAQISQAGDSGAVYIGDDNRVVGMHVGSTALNSFGCYLVYG
ncbi:MAG TPA: trypsin-like serine protease [Chitinophagaceae bacterium]|nr:trypsin-like serine protease [Chitinophagaceae bacterium]